MSGRYLTDLAAVCRRTGAVVHEEAGWQSRARGSGGYAAGYPSHVMIHHTASGAGSDGQSDVNYCCYGSGDAPLANLYLSRAGEIWVMAAGATNTNGSGHDWWGGGVPDDGMNSRAIGIEAANGGTGEWWGDNQQKVYARLVRELRGAYGIPVDHVRDHHEWAGDRKCDVTGPARWAPAGDHAGCSGAPKWNVDSFRGDQVAGWPDNLPPPLPPLPILEGETVDYLRVYRNASEYVDLARTGSLAVWMSSGKVRNADMHSRDPEPEVRTTDDPTSSLAALILVGPPPVWPDGSEWPAPWMFAGHWAL